MQFFLIRLSLFLVESSLDLDVVCISSIVKLSLLWIFAGMIGYRNHALSNSRTRILHLRRDSALLFLELFHNLFLSAHLRGR
jgi:hypothetical protein